MIKITTKTLRALEVIRDHNITMPSQFARLLWPNAPGWKVAVRTGRGSSRGRQMKSAGGVYLARLVKRDLIMETGRGYMLTKAGREVLQ